VFLVENELLAVDTSKPRTIAERVATVAIETVTTAFVSLLK